MEAELRRLNESLARRVRLQTSELRSIKELLNRRFGEQGTETTTLATEPTHSEKKRILIVDDNEQNLKVARLALESERFEVRMAGDGEQALRVARTLLPQLILMDIQLPGLDGLQVTQQLKAEPATRRRVRRANRSA